MPILFSIIIPTYNTNIEYFQRCLESVKNNNLNNDSFEVIIVNDGMEDFKEYVMIINNILKSDNINVHIINNNVNMNLGYARYVGLKKAKGQYIHFVDSDDEIYPQIYTTLKEYLKDNPNFVYFMEYYTSQEFDLISQEETFKKITGDNNLKNKLFTKKELIEIRLFTLIPLHSKVFNKEWLIKNITSWTPNSFGEDILFITEILTKVEKFKVCPEMLYKYYYLNRGSIINTLNHKLIFDFLVMYDKSLNLLQSDGWEFRHLIIDNMLNFYNSYSGYMEDNYDYFFKEILFNYTKNSKINFNFFNKQQYQWFKKNEKLYKLFAPLILSDEEIFFQKTIGSINNESIIPSDRNLKNIEFEEKIFNLNHEITNLKKNNFYKTDSNFLSAILFTLTKFTYSSEVLISIERERERERESNGLKKSYFQKIAFGMNINTNHTTKDFLAEVKNQIQKSEEYSSYFPTFKQYNDFKLPDFQYIYGEDKNVANADLVEIPQSDFSIIIENSNELLLKIIYNSSKYSFDLVQLFYNNLLIVLQKFSDENNNIPLKNIGLCSIHDDESFEFEKSELLNILFENTVNSYPNKLVLISKDGNLTFDQLNRKANKIANSLIKRGLNIEDSVIINLEQNSKLIISILGVIKSGGVFVLTNPDDVAERRNFIEEDVKAKFIINNENINELLEEENINNPNLTLSLNNPICIIYTSGSTGNPKGVLFSHKTLSDKYKTLSFNKLDNQFKFLSLTSKVYTVFILDLLSVLFNGVTFILADESLLHNPINLDKFYKRTKFNCLTITPSVIEECLEHENLHDIFKKMKIINLTGEKSNISLIKKIKKITNADLYNLYGSTETPHCNGILLTENTNTIGKPVLNIVEKVCDIDGNSLPPNMIGELWIGGYGIFKAYWNNNNLNKEKYVEKKGIIYFKTGDLAKCNENKEFTIIGRHDNQIKFHGQRIEPGEIENNIPSNYGITKTRLNIQELNENPILVLYFTTKNELTKNELLNFKKNLKEDLESKLANYMIPQIYIHLKEFPKTSSGKIDVKKLPKPTEEDLSKDSNIKLLKKPQTDLEKDIWDFCHEILGHEKIAMDDKLLDIGFTSISLLKLAGKIFEKYHINFELSNLLFENGTIETICDKIKNSKGFSYNTSNAKRDYYPITPQQLEQLNSGDIISVKLNFGKLNPLVFKNALIQNIELNNYIKTYFIRKENKFYQKRNDNYDELDIKIINKKIEEKDFITSFNPFKPPLFNFKIYYHDNETSLIFVVSHILFDAFSMSIFIDDLLQIFYDNKIPLRELDYFNYSLELSDHEKNNSSIAKSYFNKKLKKFSLDSYQISLEKNEKEKENSYFFKIDYNIEEIINFMNKNRYNNYDVLFLSSLSLAVSNLLNKKNILIEYLFNGRENLQYSNNIGLFARHIPLFFNINHGDSLKDYFNHSIENVKEGIDVPPNFRTEKLLEFFNKKSQIRVIYTFHRVQFPKFFSSENKIEFYKSYEKVNPQQNDNKLQLIIFKEENLFSAIIRYDNRYFNNSDIEKLAQSLKIYISRIINNSSEKLNGNRMI
ncbi:MAG: AMP-binding protein [Methanobrevibacter sp.]|jgi:acyl-coenzyme A synthetase/AMP-(fatty) acid ligase/glycosyltransferase involved in cell wall biosynthesis/acyl carrier protein|nr:AMP-binding protein [Methanobrevibacter sp.]